MISHSKVVERTADSGISETELVNMTSE